MPNRRLPLPVRLWNWLTGSGADDRYARLTGTALLVVALGLTAWIFYLGAALPNQGPVQDWGTGWAGIGSWQLTWVGLDVLEVAGLAATGYLLRPSHRQTRTAALLAAPIFVVDGWFDMLTDASRSGLGGDDGGRRAADRDLPSARGAQGASVRGQGPGDDPGMSVPGAPGQAAQANARLFRSSPIAGNLLVEAVDLQHVPEPLDAVLRRATRTPSRRLRVRGFPRVDEINTCVREVGDVASRQRGGENSADRRDLGVGRANGTVGAFSRGDHGGILVGSKDVEGLNSAAEVGIDDRVHGFR